ncbi:MAG TPA: hypothetical protein VLM40_00960 [Gemmata sp.]|nr:hypothetical protein [Gemmata sp.]
MALISMGESKWRMLRRALKKKRFKFEDTRNMARQDKLHFEWLINHGLIEPAGEGYYAVTEKGKEAADLGFYEV